MKEEFAARMRSLPRPILVALDIDGTLARIVDRPEDAAIPEPILKLLGMLSEADDLILAFVTGRDTAMAMKMTSGIIAWRATQHGRFVLAPQETTIPAADEDEESATIVEFRSWLEEHLADAHLEEKPGAIAVHVRQLQDDPIRAAHILQEATAEGIRRGLSVRKGRAACEFEVETGDKATALRDIYERSGAASVLFAGDDLTDFESIEFAASRGVGVFISSEERPLGPTSATITIKDTATFADFLAGILR